MHIRRRRGLRQELAWQMQEEKGGEMQWYVFYVLALLYWLFPSEAVECYTPRQLGKYIPVKGCLSVGVQEVRLSRLSGAAISLCRQQAWRGHPSLCTLKPVLTVNPFAEHIRLHNLSFKKSRLCEGNWLKGHFGVLFCWWRFGKGMLVGFFSWFEKNLSAHLDIRPCSAELFGLPMFASDPTMKSWSYGRLNVSSWLMLFWFCIFKCRIFSLRKSYYTLINLCIWFIFNFF